METYELIDQLIQSKSFDELTMKEKTLVLEEYSEVDYTNLRLAFSEINNTKPISLDPSLKTLLLKEFNSVHDKSRLVWYNRLALFLFPQEKSWVSKPGFQMAFASLVFIIGGFFIWNLSLDQESVLAQNKMIPMEEVHEEEKEVVSESDVKPNNAVSEEGEVKSTASTLVVSRDKEVLVREELVSNANISDEELLPIVANDGYLDVMEDNLSQTITTAGLSMNRPSGEGKSKTGAVSNYREVDEKKDIPRKVTTSISLNDEPDLLDLLSATF